MYFENVIRLPVEGWGKQEETMRAVTVYRVDYDRRTKVPIGVVLENRKTERKNNYNDLLRLARRLFAFNTADSVHIVVDMSQARQSLPPEAEQGVFGGVVPKMQRLCECLSLDHDRR